MPPAGYFLLILVLMRIRLAVDHTKLVRELAEQYAVQVCRRWFIQASSR